MPLPKEQGGRVLGATAGQWKINSGVHPSSRASHTLVQPLITPSPALELSLGFHLS